MSESVSVECAFCGASLRAEAKFCTSCGNALVQFESPAPSYQEVTELEELEEFEEFEEPGELESPESVIEEIEDEPESIIPRFDRQTGEPIAPDASRFDRQTGEPIVPDALRFDKVTGEPLTSAPRNLHFAPPSGSPQTVPVTLNRKAFRTFVPTEELPVEGFTILSRGAFSLNSRKDIIDETLGGISRKRSVSDNLPDWDPLPPVKQSIKRKATVGASAGKSGSKRKKG